VQKRFRGVNVAFNGWLLGSICLFPLGIIFMIISIPLLKEEAEISGMSLLVIGGILLILATIFLIIGLVRYGQQKKY